MDESLQVVVRWHVRRIVLCFYVYDDPPMLICHCREIRKRPVIHRNDTMRLSFTHKKKVDNEQHILYSYKRHYTTSSYNNLLNLLSATTHYYVYLHTSNYGLTCCGHL